MLCLNSGRDQLLLLSPKYLDPCLFLSLGPILSCLAEKLVVRNWLFPAIDSTVIADQFAFKPTGSTTCALIFFMCHVTRLLEDISYVRCLLIDFSKAFDVVDHGILVSKAFSA